MLFPSDMRIAFVVAYHRPCYNNKLINTREDYDFKKNIYI